jgi:alkylation response protein AidB-like acyl-CoA dehydrogenase
MSAADPEARAQTPEIDERHARAVAEQAREGTSALPGFAKELYLGRLRLDLIHPMPVPDREDEERGEAFLARLHDFCEGIDAQRIEREERIPDEVVAGLRELGALGMKIPAEYGGLGLSQVHYNRALTLVGSVSPAIGPPVDRRAPAGVHVRHPGAETGVPAALHP